MSRLEIIQKLAASLKKHREENRRKLRAVARCVVLGVRVRLPG